MAQNLENLVTCACIHVDGQTYDLLLLQNTTRTMRAIANTTAHATATPIKTPDPLLFSFVLASLFPEFPKGSVTKDVCKEHHLLV